jgi:Mg/Co/Ni transporter MgtE
MYGLAGPDPQTPLPSFVTPRPVRVHTDADVVELAIVMSDYNLVLLPVTDNKHRMLGVVTVDEVLETTIPDDWRRRGPTGHPGG